MTVCNMAIEAGARAGLVAVDQKTIDYVNGRPFAPGTDRQTGQFVGGAEWDHAVAYWQHTALRPRCRASTQVVDLDGFPDRYRR